MTRENDFGRPGPLEPPEAFEDYPWCAACGLDFGEIAGLCQDCDAQLEQRRTIVSRIADALSAPATVAGVVGIGLLSAAGMLWCLWLFARVLWHIVVLTFPLVVVLAVLVGVGCLFFAAGAKR